MTDVGALNKELIAGQPKMGGVSLNQPGWWLNTVESADWSKLLPTLNGDFALAARKSDGSSVLAVDRFAVQTLCYSIRGNNLEWATQASDLAGNSPEIDPQALFEYLYFHAIPSPRTIFKGVKRLPPGRSAEFKGGQVQVSSFWQPSFSTSQKPDFPKLREEFRSILKASVRRRLDGNIPACFLSGGTDSSTVAGMIREVAGSVATYSIGFEAEGYDEMEYARVAAKRFGSDHHEYYVTPDDLVKSIAQVASYYDQPFGNSSALPAFYCAQHARSNGVTRILAGDGGDELFGGNTRYAMQEIFGWYQQVPEVVRLGLLEPFFKLPFVKHLPILKRAPGYIRQANTPLPERLQAFNLIKRLGYSNIFEPEFLKQIDTVGVSNFQNEVWKEATTQNEIDRFLAYDWRYTLAESDLPKVRGTAALAGIEVAFPMLDDELLAFSMRLPAHYKLNRLRLRWFFKEALRGFLPDEILTKKKQGFGLPFGVWVMKHKALERLAKDSVQSFAQRGIVKPAFIKQLLEVHLPDHPHYYGTMVWILMMAEQWMRVHASNFKIERAD